jgi:hypothetical protein
MDDLQNKYFYFLRSNSDFQDFIRKNHLEDYSFLRNEEFLKSEFLYVEQEDIEGYDFLILTSKMAAKSLIFNKITIPKNQKIIKVGNALSSDETFSPHEIEFLAKNVEEIVLYINNISNFLEKKFLYLRGNHITLDLRDYFSDRVVIDERMCYVVNYNATFSSEFLFNLKNRLIGKIVFFSFQSIKHFVESIVNCNFKEYLKFIEAVVMNKDSSKLGINFFREIKVSSFSEIISDIKSFKSN